MIAGVGNELLSDDGVGVHAIADLEKDPLPGITPIAIGTDILRGLRFVEAAERVLIIDAAHGGQPPGTIYLIDSNNLGLKAPMHSLHSMGLREALRVLSPNCPPPPITIIGVEPSSFDYSFSLSPAVEAALPQVVALARKIVEEWLRCDSFACHRQAPHPMMIA